ncbi:MAG: copper transporter [Armatimonadota bacterium]
MPIDYRYHIGSLVAVFLALLLGILIGIGLVGNPQEVERMVEGLRKDSETKDAEIAQLREAERQADMLGRETVAALIAGRLAGKRVAIVADHDFGDDPLLDTLRGTLRSAQATIISTTVLTKAFVTLPPEVRRRVTRELNLYPPPGVYVRTIIAEAIARDIVRGNGSLILGLQRIGLLKAGTGFDYVTPPDVVLVIGGAKSATEIAPERIDLPLIKKLTELGVRVVGVEAAGAGVSVTPLYKAAGVSTVDNADTLSGRLATVMALAGANGHFGVKDTADSFLPPIPALTRP